MPITRIDMQKLVESASSAGYSVHQVIGLCIDATGLEGNSPEKRFAMLRAFMGPTDWPLPITLPCGRRYSYFCLGDVPLRDVICGCGSEKEWVIRWFFRTTGVPPHEEGPKEQGGV